MFCLRKLINCWQLKGFKAQCDYQFFGFHRLGMGIDRLAVLNGPIDWQVNDTVCEHDEPLLWADDSE